MFVKNYILLMVLALFVSACRAQPTQTEPAAPDAPAFTPTTPGLPLREAEVPRVTVEEAKAALDSGAAIVVDVRRAESFAASHIPGALNIQLGEFETNPIGISLDKDKWIIAYCT